MKRLIICAVLFNTLLINTIYADEVTALQCNDAVNKQDFSKALLIANQLLKAKSKDKDALICKARALSLSGDLALAVKTFDEAKKNTKEPFDQIIIHILEGNAYVLAKKTDEAIIAYQASVDFAIEQNNTNYARIGFNFLGDTYYKTGQFQKALQPYLKAYSLTANDNERGESHENVAITHYRLGDYDKALAYQIKAFNMHDKAGTLDQFANSSITLGNYYRLNKNLAAAENTLNKIIKFTQEQGGAYFEAKASYTLALVKREQGDLEKAKALIEMAKKIATDSGDKALTEEIAIAVQ